MTLLCHTWRQYPPLQARSCSAPGSGVSVEDLTISEIYWWLPPGVCPAVQVSCYRTSTRYTSLSYCLIVSWGTRRTVSRDTERPGMNTVRKYHTELYLMYSNHRLELVTDRLITCMDLPLNTMTVKPFCRLTWDYLVFSIQTLISFILRQRDLSQTCMKIMLVIQTGFDDTWGRWFFLPQPTRLNFLDNYNFPIV